MRSMEMFDVIHFSSLHVKIGDAKTEIIKKCDAKEIIKKCDASNMWQR